MTDGKYIGLHVHPIVRSHLGLLVHYKYVVGIRDLDNTNECI